MRIPTICLGLTAVAVTALAATRAPRAPLPHPHFSKKVVVELSDDLTITVSHITVPFSAKRAADLPAGGSWHLGNAHIETTAPISVGGVEVAAGKHAIKASKLLEGGWELVLDAPGRFQRQISDAGVPLTTEFEKGTTVYEHLSIDVQPAGDKENTRLWLDVRFDAMLARVPIEIPAGKDK